MHAIWCQKYAFERTEHICRPGAIMLFQFLPIYDFNYFSNFIYYVHQSTKILPINLMKSIVKVCMVKVKIYYSTRVQEIVLYNLVRNGLVAG